MGNISRTQYQNNQFAPKRKENGLFFLSTLQTTGLADGNPVKFNTVGNNNGVTFDPANYRVTLKANKTYLIETMVRHSFSGAGYSEFQVYNVTSAAYIGTKGRPVSVSYTGNAMNTDLAVAIITPTVDTVIEVRTVTPNSVDGIYSEHSYLRVQELDAYEQPNTYPFEMNANQVDLTVTGTNWTTTRAVGLAYKTLNEVWRLRFNIVGARASGSSIANYVLTISGITFKTLSAGTGQGIFGDSDGAPGAAIVTYALSGSSNMQIYYSSSTNTLTHHFFGDVELDSKPTWI